MQSQPDVCASSEAPPERTLDRRNAHDLQEASSEGVHSILYSEIVGSRGRSNLVDYAGNKTSVRELHSKVANTFNLGDLRPIEIHGRRHVGRLELQLSQVKLLDFADEAISIVHYDDVCFVFGQEICRSKEAVSYT